MTIVKELNNLSKVVTGKEGVATTDAQAIKFIADNYEGGGAQIDITDIIDAYENGGSLNKYTYTFSSESDVNTLDDALYDAAGKPLIATITIGDDSEYVDVINYAYKHDSNEDIYYDTFYICRECGFDYNAGTITILHIKGTLIYEDIVNSKVEIIKEVKTIS